MKGLLFLCVANSARSQMAEGMARSLAGLRISVYSAGSRPGKLHPLAVQVMQEIGLDISRQAPKGLEAVPLKKIDTVVTLCGDEICPVFPRPVLAVHWPLADPAAVKGTLSTRLRAFRRVRTELRFQIGHLLEMR
ncbi:MAG: arsenate reductase ArsC [Acidobacteriota bacterium]